MNLIINKYTIENLDEWDNFVLYESLNGTIYHTQRFLSYHKHKYDDTSIIIYDNKKIIGVFPCCKVDNEYYSHRGSTCGGIVILEKYYELTKLSEIMDKIYKYYNKNLYIKLSERIYFKNKNNDLLIFVLSRKCKIEQDLSLYFNINKTKSIIDNFPKNDNKRLLLKYIKNNNNFQDKINIKITDNVKDYELFYNHLSKSLLDKNGVKPLHTLDEFIQLKDILKENQFLLLAKNNTSIISGAYVFLINEKTYYTVYLMTNYQEEYSHIFYILYELFELAKKNNISIVNLGACSINGGEEILYNKYKFKYSCGCESILKYSFSYNNLKNT